MLCWSLLQLVVQRRICFSLAIYFANRGAATTLLASGTDLCKET